MTGSTSGLAVAGSRQLMHPNALREKRRRPVVVGATRVALDETRRLVGGEYILENEVVYALFRARVGSRPRDLSEALAVDVGLGLEAVVVAQRSATTGLLGWRIVSVRERAA